MSHLETAFDVKFQAGLNYGGKIQFFLKMPIKEITVSVPRMCLGWIYTVQNNQIWYYNMMSLKRFYALFTNMNQKRRCLQKLSWCRNQNFSLDINCRKKLNHFDLASLSSKNSNLNPKLNIVCESKPKYEDGDWAAMQTRDEIEKS